MSSGLAGHFFFKGIIGGEGCSEGVGRGDGSDELGHGAQTPDRDPGHAPSPSAAIRRKSGEVLRW